MGLPNQLTDISTDSIPLLIIATIATAVSHLRSIFLTLLNLLHINRIPKNHNTSLADQLNMNRIFAYKYGVSNDDSFGSDCVVCLCGLKEGDQVRRLPCCHVFHKSCFDGWLDHLNFNCPLCRSTLVNAEVVAMLPLNRSTDQSFERVTDASVGIGA